MGFVLTRDWSLSQVTNGLEVEYGVGVRSATMDRRGITSYPTVSNW